MRVLKRPFWHTMKLPLVLCLSVCGVGSAFLSAVGRPYAGRLHSVREATTAEGKCELLVCGVSRLLAMPTQMLDTHMLLRCLDLACPGIMQPVTFTLQAEDSDPVVLEVTDAVDFDKLLQGLGCSV